MKQRELEMRLQRLDGFPSPRPDLEQYPTPAKIAAEVLYAAHARGDIEGRSVIDLGCGTGIFAIGASLLGASSTVGIDIDRDALAVARRNAAACGCEIDFRQMPVEEAAGAFDTCIMNPPFGSQTRHADIPFLEKAIEVASAVYTMHNSGTMEYLRKLVGQRGWRIDYEKEHEFEIRHTFGFHTKEKAYFGVTVFRMARA